MQRVNGIETRPLELEAVIGFEGKGAPGALCLHPDGLHQIYPLGSTIVIRSVANPAAQRFLQGQTDFVTCIDVSPCGRYIASGQRNAFGFPADVIVWSYADLRPLHQLKLHTTKVQSVSFSGNGNYLVTVGGDGDKRLAVWESATGHAVCAASMPMPGVETCRFFNTRDDLFVTGGLHGLLFYTVDRVDRKMTYEFTSIGSIKRVISCCIISQDDEYVYCGTTSGDVLQVLIRSRTLKSNGPTKLFSRGVLSLQVTPCKDEILIGGGDGDYSVMRTDTFRVLRTGKVPCGVTSITTIDTRGNFYIGTSESAMHSVAFNTLVPTLTNSCHHGPISGLNFPDSFSSIFVTCGQNEIRVWNIETSQEILRITEPQQKVELICSCVFITPDGRTILSGWSDGKVRAYSPETGRSTFVIHDANPGGVSAIATTSDSCTMMTGGVTGMVRTWRLGSVSQSLVFSMKEHRGKINMIKIARGDAKFVSCGDDGSCVVWNVAEGIRSGILAASTFFHGVCYHPDHSQMITCGSDRKVTFWDASDGSAIRVLEGSEEEIYGLDLTKNGAVFVSCGADKRVRVWDYETANPLYTGVGHSAAVLKCQISPDQRYIISCGAEGAIFKWRLPNITVGRGGRAETGPRQTSSGSGRTPAASNRGGGRGGARGGRR